MQTFLPALQGDFLRDGTSHLLADDGSELVEYAATGATPGGHLSNRRTRNVARVSSAEFVFTEGGDNNNFDTDQGGKNLRVEITAQGFLWAMDNDALSDIYRSSDGGDTWVKVADLSDQSMACFRLFATPSGRLIGMMHFDSETNSHPWYSDDGESWLPCSLSPLAISSGAITATIETNGTCTSSAAIFEKRYIGRYITVDSSEYRITGWTSSTVITIDPPPGVQVTDQLFDITSNGYEQNSVAHLSLIHI